MDNVPERSVVSDANFQEMLLEAIAIVKRLDARIGGFVVYQIVGRQLEAMSRWTANGRRPTLAEEQSIYVGLISVRELESDPSPEVQDLCNRLCELDYYFNRSDRLCDAVEAGHVDDVRRLLDNGVSPNAKNGAAVPAIYLAVMKRYFEVLEVLLSRGAIISNDLLPLAAQQGDSKTVGLLLKHRASAKSKDAEGFSVLFLAVGASPSVLSGDEFVHQLAVFLLDPVNHLPKKTAPPDPGYLDVIRALVISGADVNEQYQHFKKGEVYGLTPLMVAAAFGHDNIYQLLLELGADPGIKDSAGHTAADWKSIAS